MRAHWFLLIAIATTRVLADEPTNSTDTSVASAPAPSSSQEPSPNRTQHILVVPRGEYASIDVKSTQDIIDKLRGTVGNENDALINQIEQNSGNYSPPVFFALTNVLYDKGDLYDAIFWFNAGRLRADYDAMRCTDISARSAVGVLVMTIPVGLRKAQFNDVGKLRDITAKLIKWDEATPYNYDCRWIALHGLQFSMASLSNAQATGGALTVPRNEWDALAQQNRDVYQKSLDQALATRAQFANSAVSTISIAAPDSPESSSTGAVSSALKIVPQTSIDVSKLGIDLYVMKLTFSPDGRYLAIVAETSLSDGMIIIWDVVNNREQARIRDPKISVFANSFASEVAWSPDGKTISLGASERPNPRNMQDPLTLKFWDPMTGKIVKEIPNIKIGMGSRLSLDGTKFLCYAGTWAHPAIRIYDTGMWSYQDFPCEDIHANLMGALLWTPEGKILVVNECKTNPIAPAPGIKQGDILARSIDPTEKNEPVTVMLEPSIPTVPPSKFFRPNFMACYWSVDFAGHKIALGSNKIKVIDSNTLRVLYSYPPSGNEMSSLGGVKFSADGKFLFVMDLAGRPGNSLILDGQTGRVVGSFSGGGAGLDISKNGLTLVVGQRQKIQLYSLNEM